MTRMVSILYTKSEYVKKSDSPLPLKWMAIESTLSQVLSMKYDKLEQWMHANKLVINPDKTHLMVMGSKKHTAARKEVSITASGHLIKPTDTEKLLGGQLH